MSTYEISQSSLLSLKAEILRKQEEVTRAKIDNEFKLKILKKSTPLEIKNKGVEARNETDQSEENEVLKQSRSALEIKSLLYDKLSQGNLTEKEKDLNKHFLVRFDKKSKLGTDNLPPPESDEEPDKFPESDEDNYLSDEDNTETREKWVDYVDCLGRTRTCLETDLEYLKSKDQDLQEVVAARNKNEEENVCLDDKAGEEVQQSKEDNTINQESELLSSDMRRELMRQQWEKEEDKLRNKSDIHYQDILFGEARTHGVGYYSFSKNEEERFKQQEGLTKLRRETEDKQKKTQELKLLRERQLAARIKAAKDRKRARLGLPPEVEEEPQLTSPPSSEDKEEEEENKKKEEVEKMLEEMRKQHVRPWDIGKEGVKKPEHYEMTQEEWVEQKRSERPEDFAPPSSYKEKTKAHKNQSDTNNKLTRTKNRNTRCDPSENSNTTKDSKKVREFSRLGQMSQTTHFEPISIANLCDSNDAILADYKRMTDSKVEERPEKRKGAEIAPPPTFDYYGPGRAKVVRTSKPSDIQESIEAGLKFLRTQVERRQHSKREVEDDFKS